MSSSSGKRRASSQGGKKKPSLEQQRESNSKEIRQLEDRLVSCQTEEVRLEAEIAKKQRIDALVELVSEDHCMICRIDLHESLGVPNMALVSYKCRCSKLRAMHLGCWVKPFRCACGAEATLHLKSASGKGVRVTVEEMTDEEEVLEIEEDIEIEEEEGDVQLL